LKYSLKKLEEWLDSEEGQKDLQEFIDSLPSGPPVGWVDIEENLPGFMASDLMQGYSVYKVKNEKGEIFETHVTDPGIWYVRVKELGVTHWYNTIEPRKKKT
jgi:hypothetical protein